MAAFDHLTLALLPPSSQVSDGFGGTGRTHAWRCPQCVTVPIDTLVRAMDCAIIRPGVGIYTIISLLRTRRYYTSLSSFPVSGLGIGTALALAVFCFLVTAQSPTLRGFATPVWR